MRCPDCNIEVACKTDVCPLCHKKLDTTEEIRNEIKKLERSFPPRLQNRPFATTSFPRLYFIIAMNILVISIVLNIILTPQIYWSFLVFSGIIYLYFFVRKTVLSYSHFNIKVMGQAIFLFLIFILIQNVLHKNLWIYEFVLPSIVLISIIMIASYIITNISIARRYIMSLFTLAIIGLIPLFIGLYIKDILLWPSIVVAVTSASIIISTLIVSNKTFFAEIKRIFHI